MNLPRYTVLLALCATLAHAQSTTDDERNRPLTVYDANGRAVGPYLPFENSDGLLVETNGVLVSSGDLHAVIPLRRKPIGTLTFPGQQIYDLPASGTQFLYADAYYTGGGPSFPTADCSGDPFLGWSAGPALAAVYREGNSVAVYFAGSGPPRYINILSTRQPPQNLCVRLMLPSQNFAYAVGAKIVITDEHPEPLTIGF